jgi:hypothetical protein
MREGHISSEEVDSTLARFVPGWAVEGLSS